MKNEILLIQTPVNQNNIMFDDEVSVFDNGNSSMIDEINHQPAAYPNYKFSTRERYICARMKKDDELKKYSSSSDFYKNSRKFLCF